MFNDGKLPSVPLEEILKSVNTNTIFTARCYAERGYATVSRPSQSLCPSACESVTVTLRYDFHTG